MPRPPHVTICVALICSAVIIGCISGVVQQNWYAVHADGNNSDYTHVKGARNISILWHRKFDGTINLGATTDASGQVYITTSADGCHLYALDPRTGETVWCSAEIGRLAVASSALVDENGSVFIADNAYMFSFDSSGKLRWKSPIVGFPLSAQLTSSQRLLFITHIGIVYVLDKETGRTMLKQELTSGNSSRVTEFDPIACMRGTQDCPCANTLAVDRKSDRFYFTYWESAAPKADVVAMQFTEKPSARAEIVWRNSSLPGGSASSPDISFSGDRIYVNDNEGGLHALDAATGKNIWRYEIGYPTGGSQSTSPGGVIVPAGGAKAPLLCLVDKGDSAQLRWRTDSVINRGVATQAAGGLIYATLADQKKGRMYNYLAVIDADSGEQIDQEALPGITIFTVGTTIGPEGNVYVPAFNGNLFAFRPAPHEKKDHRLK
jgi:outer membrane protein assembly factor BamB